MKKDFYRTNDRHARSRGVGTVEIIVVLLIICLLAAFAIPELLSARRLMKFTNIQQRITAELREARQFAMSQRRRITVRYDDSAKKIITYENSATPMPEVVLGDLGDSRNRVVTLTDDGLLANDIRYGAPSAVSLAELTLADTSAFTCPSVWTPPTSPSAKTCPGEIVSITFNPRGDVVVPATGVTDSNKAMFFYDNTSNTTFAISVLAPGGRIKIWRYNGTTYQ